MGRRLLDIRKAPKEPQCSIVKHIRQERVARRLAQDEPAFYAQSVMPSLHALRRMHFRADRAQAARLLRSRPEIGRSSTIWRDFT